MNIRRRFSTVLLFGGFICIAGIGTGCVSLNSYSWDPTHTRYIQNPLDKAITDDVHKFILTEKIPQTDISDLIYGDGPNGSHAAIITQEIPKSQGKKVRYYILFYDKNNVRIKMRSHWGGRSC